uniref:LAGLIDADG endonuclease n=1 Tax=Annulohypoxylon stygium TaxID=326628 RepID=V5RDS2_9PEZI|nr:LAGLIDADG endonuclease [Annulohypoxylon stygium]AHB33532.1 LAGLIDADG endonuclease [Annulohypoxylon stygium]
MMETEIGNRGSKSIVYLITFLPSQIKYIIVKEQRVDGSCIELNTFKDENVPMLRCTLAGLERGCRNINKSILINTDLFSKITESSQNRILSNQLNNVRFYSSMNKAGTRSNINPWFLTGFADGEASFLVNVYKSSSHNSGWGARATFQIGLHKKDIAILNNIQDYFGVGSVTTKTKGCVYYVQAIKDLDVILNHFDHYPLVTKKYADYLLFKLAINLIKEKAHMNSEGLRKLVAIRASLNWGLPSDLNGAFPGIVAYPRPEVSDISIKDPQWLAGFASAEGCFLVKITKAITHRSGYQVSLIFKLVQHSRDEELIRSLVNYLGCGTIILFNSAIEYRVTRFSDLTDKIIPLFQKFPIQGVKFLDYKDFVRVLELMNNKLHLTPNGLEQIKFIKENMNKGRE